MKGYEICFFRHGIALDREDPGVTSDAERPLTEEVSSLIVHEA